MSATLATAARVVSHAVQLAAALVLGSLAGLLGYALGWLGLKLST